MSREELAVLELLRRGTHLSLSELAEHSGLDKKNLEIATGCLNCHGIVQEAEDGKYFWPWLDWFMKPGTQLGKTKPSASERKVFKKPVRKYVEKSA